MSQKSIVVLGGGNTAFSAAAKLALEGHDVWLWEAPSQEASLAPIHHGREIRLTGVGGQGTARVLGTTTNAAEALSKGDILLAPVPSYAHAAFAECLVPHLGPQHVLALLPGNLGSLYFANRLAAAGKTPGESGPVVAESDTAPYVCRKLAADHAHIWGIAAGMGVGVFPATCTERAMAALAPLFPGAKAYPHALAAGLGAMNPIVHPPGVLMNAGRIEYSRGEFYFYEEGVTPGVVRAIEALDVERRALGSALGLSLPPVAEAFHTAGFGPQGDLWAAINGSRMLTQLRAPGSLQTRWLSEDVPYGLRTWAELGALIGVAMPVAQALVTLGDAVMGIDSWKAGRSLHDLGIAGLDKDALVRFLGGAGSRA